MWSLNSQNVASQVLFALSLLAILTDTNFANLCSVSVLVFNGVQGVFLLFHSPFLGNLHVQQFLVVFGTF